MEVDMSDGPISPAVKSLLAEQADQSAADKTRLEEGLEDTFPASDPVSATHTATASAPTGSDEGEFLGLRPMRQPDSPAEFQRAELQSLQRDVVALREKIATTRHRQVMRTPVVSGLLMAVALLGGAAVLFSRAANW
jgi:hypothetical protein